MKTNPSDPRSRRLLAVLLLLAAALPAFAQAGVPADGRPATIEEFLRLGGGPWVIAHRGFSGQAPENTLAAVRLAIEAGADMVEIDVSLTRDRQVVVIHDETLGRTTDGRGAVADHTLEEIRRLDAGSWFDPRFAGEKVPTLTEVLDLVRGRILLDVEIKNEAVTDETEGGIVERVLDEIAERRMGHQVILSSFAPQALLRARQLDPTIPTASLYQRQLHRGMGCHEILNAVGSRALKVSARRLSKKMLRQCHQHDRPLAVYTVNRRCKMRRLTAKGVDALFTDHPDRLLEVLDRPSAVSGLEPAPRAGGGSPAPQGRHDLARGETPGPG